MVDVESSRFCCIKWQPTFIKNSYINDFNADLAKKVSLIRYIEQNFAKIMHDVALAIERHNAMLC